MDTSGRWNSTWKGKKYIQGQNILRKVNCITEDWVRDVDYISDGKKGF